MTVYAKARLELKNGLSAKYFHLLTEAAEAGNAEAMCDLGLWLLDGCRDSMGRTLVRRSSSKGYHLVSRAAAAGNSMALLTRGTCLADGVGVRANRAAAKRLLRAAARAGEEFAAFNLATLYRDSGERAKELYWLRRAVALGDRAAALTIAEIGLADPRATIAARSRRYLQRIASASRDSDRRAEAREILAHFARVGSRRWLQRGSRRGK
jgi:TPR repeat protein